MLSLIGILPRTYNIIIHAFKISYLVDLNLSLLDLHTGQIHVFGISLNAVPGGIPCEESPIFGLYT